jgi:uncharacterized membrane protein YdfJ with MMPL/SSD domain
MERNTNFTARVGRWSTQHRKAAILGWIAFVVVSLAIGTSAAPMKTLEQGEGLPGESGVANEVIEGAYPDKASEQVLIQSDELTAHDPAFEAAVADTSRRLEGVVGVANVVSPYDDGGAISADGHSALIDFELTGDEQTTAESVEGSLAAVADAQTGHPGLRIEEVGEASLAKGLMDKSNEELGASVMLSLPITLIILLFAFGTLLVAGIPLFLALTSVAGTMGLVGIASQIAPMEASVMHVVMLIGMAVGVDYSLFYVKRAREERASGRSTDAAVEAAAATSGRAVLVSGFTVAVAMAGMYLGGVSNFASFATGTILVVAVAVIGSLTVLPALLSKLGDRIDRGRVPLIGRIKRRVGEIGIWSRVLDRVLRRPVVSAVGATALLVALAIPALGIETSLGGIDDASRDVSVVRIYDRVQEAFPSEGSSEMVVLKADDVTAPAVTAAIDALAEEAGRRSELFEGRISQEISADETVSIVTVPIVGSGTEPLAMRAADVLRADIVPATVGGVDGVDAYTSGEASVTGDFNVAMADNLPLVFGFVLAAAFMLLLVTFRSLVIPIKAIVLNLLSVSAAYGVLVLVFQSEWAEGLLGFEGNGAIAAWLPMFLFVILFGLSMDYHVFILSRIREAFDGGMSTGAAVAHGIKSTAGVVTSAAVVMVAVFSLFALSSELQLKQMGVGLAVAVLLDATVVRGVLLPASMKLLGDWNWWLPRRPRRASRISPEPELPQARA